jgi:two-component system, OmpR family, sensor histidine kinase TctE
MQAELAQRDISADEKAAALSNISIGIARTAHLINQLLMLARTEGAASSALPFAAVDLTRLAREVLANAYPAASAKQITLHFEAPDNALIVNGHRDLLHELTSNLVDNAIQYTPTGGNVTIRLATTHATNGVSLEVEDDGVGIPRAEQELVFERFYRVLNSADDNPNDNDNDNDSDSENKSATAPAQSAQNIGSGIGLAIVREIATRHGATVTAATPEGGKGSVFRVAFAAVTM